MTRTLSDLTASERLGLHSSAAALPRLSGLEDEVLAVFDATRKSLLRYLYSLGLRDHDAEEVVQEVFLALFQHLRRGGARHNLRGWTWRVAHNLGLRRLDHVRRMTGLPCDRDLAEPADPRPDPEQQLEARERRARLLTVFDALPQQDRLCLHLRSEGMRYREIAKILGVSLGSVARILTRSLERLRHADERL